MNHFKLAGNAYFLTNIGRIYMKTRRLLGNGKTNYYHLVSHSARNDPIFWDEEKLYFQKLIRRMEKFTGVQVLTYCIMPDHFHVLVKITECNELSDKELLERMNEYYSRPMVEKIRETYKELKESAKKEGNEDALNAWRKRYLDRMGSLTCFGQGLKEVFSKWYNRKEGRTGCLWAGLFKSVLVEGSELALLTTAAYIDLNPVRAKLVKDPKDYPFCGYGEAMGGEPLAKLGISTSSQLKTSDWNKALALYQTYLFGEGKEIDFEQIKEALESKGKLSLQELLNCQTRYFSSGVAIGSKQFLEEVFKTNRAFFGENRKNGARKIKIINEPLYCLRDLKKEPIRIPI